MAGILEYSASPHFYTVRQAFLNTLMAQPVFPPVVVGIVENNRRARQMREQLLAHGVTVPQVYSWEQVFWQLFSLVDTRVPLPYNAVLESLLQVWWQQNEKFQTRLYLPLGLLQRLYQFFDFWFSNIIEGDDRFKFSARGSVTIRDGYLRLNTTSNASFAEPTTGVERLLMLYRELRTELGENFADPIAVYQRCQDVSIRVHPVWRQVQQVVVEVTRPLRMQHRKWLRFLENQGIAVQLFLHRGKNKAVFSDMHFMDEGNPSIHHLSTENTLAERFLNFSAASQHPASAFLVALPNRLQEVRWVARKVRQLVRDQGIPLNQIAVAASDSATYAPIVVNTFRDFAIPLQTETAVPLARNPVVQAIVQWVACAAGEETLTHVIPILESPWLNYHQWLNGMAIEEILRELRVPQGVATLREQAQKMQQYFSGADIIEEETLQNRYFSQLNQALGALQEELAEFTACRTPVDYVQFMVKFVEQHRLMERAVRQLSEQAPQQAAENFRALRGWIQALDDWQKRTRMTVLSVPMFFQVVQLLIQTTTYIRPFNNAEGVRWLALDDLLDADLAVVFVLGMSESHFPQAHQPVLEGMPRVVQHMLAEEYIHHQRRWLTALLEIPQRETFFLYPLREAESDQIPSVYLQELERLGALVRLKTTELPVPDPVSWQDYLYQQHLQGVRPMPEQSMPLGLAPPAQVHQAVTIFQQQEDLTRPPSPFEGNLHASADLQQVLMAKIAQHTFSPSALELYARCAMAYFLRYEVRLPEITPRQDFLTPLEKGNLVHTVLYRFYTEVAPVERSRQKLLAIAREELERLPLPDNFWRQFLMYQFLGNPDGTGLFEALFDQLQTLDDMLESYGLSEVQAEQPFGLSKTGWPFLVLEAEEHTVRLRGKIDRINRNDRGDFVVIDYKTGKPPGARDIAAGRSLQLPVYMMAAQKFLPQAGKPLGAGFVYVGEERAVRWPLVSEIGPFSANNARMIEEVIPAVAQIIHQYVNGIRQGNFTHTVEANHCRGCGYLLVCRRVVPKMQARRRQIPPSAHQ